MVIKIFFTLIKLATMIIGFSFNHVNNPQALYNTQLLYRNRR
jgi:hypothetical protein